MPNAGDPYLQGLALPLSHNPLQRLEFTSQMPYLSPARLEQAQEDAITQFLTVLKSTTGLDLLDTWNKSLTVKHANQAFAQALQNAITNYTSWNSFFTQVSAAWNTWIATVTDLSSAQFPDLNDLLASLFGVNPSTGGNAGAELTAQRQQRKAQNDVIINDWLHQTYPIGTYTDTASTLVGGKRTWWGAWNDNLHLLGEILGIVAPTDPASDVGTAVGTAQATANTGVSNAGLAQTTANTNATRTARKAQNDAIIADWLHQQYPLGSITDTATTLVGGKRTWWGAVNDNLLLVAQMLGLAQQTPDPTADVGTATQVAQATANTGVSNAGAAQTTANTAQTAAGTAQTTANTATSKANQNAAWATRKAQNDQILGDWLHATYPVGSVSDTAATLVGGKRTYWGAWNDNLKIISEQLGLSPATDPMVDIGTQTQLNTAAANTAASNAALASASNQDLTNKIIASQTGVEPTNGTSAGAYDALTNIPASNIQGQTGATVTFGTASSSPVTNTGGSSSTLSTTLLFTPLSTDTQVDVIVGFSGQESSTRTIACKLGGVAQAQIIRQAANPINGITELAVFRVPVTPTASPAQMSFTIEVTSTDGQSRVTAMAMSYAGVKVNYSTATIGALSAGANSVSMSMTSDATKRIFQVVSGRCSSSTTTTATTSGGSVKCNFPYGSTPMLFVQEKAAVAGTNTLSCSVTTANNATGVGQYVAVLIEISN